MNDFDNVEILLVEDSRTDADLMMRALRKNRLENKVLWVQDGVEALEFIRCSGTYVKRDSRHQPRLILLDLKMPRLNGIDVLRTLKSAAETRPIPIVVMTSSNEPRDLAECYQLGVNGYVTKPIQFADLTETAARIGSYWLLVNQVP
jgi:two-component system response regulator